MFAAPMGSYILGSRRVRITKSQLHCHPLRTLPAPQASDTYEATVGNVVGGAQDAAHQAYEQAKDTVRTVPTYT